MWNTKKLLAFVVAAAVCTSLWGCAHQTAQETTLEAGDWELLTVLCAHEGIQRKGDPDHTVKVVEDGGWNPFLHNGAYQVKYQKVRLRDQKTEEKTLTIHIQDTLPPSLVPMPDAPAAPAEISVAEGADGVERKALAAIKDAYQMWDNGSSSPMELSKDNVTVGEIDLSQVGEVQKVAFTVADQAGNEQDGEIEILLTE